MDIEGQIKDGVIAFMQSQDPAIAVEVVKMLAEMMGVAPELDPYSDRSQAATPAQGQQAPMARNGLRFRMYAKGGKIKKYANGGDTDPDPKKNPAPADTTQAPPPPVLTADIYGNITDQSVVNPEQPKLPEGLYIPGNRYTLKELGLDGKRSKPITQDEINYRFHIKNQEQLTPRVTPASYIRTKK